MQPLQAFLFGIVLLLECCSLLVSAQAPVSTPAYTPSSYPVCYVCGGDPDATMSNPTELIDIPPEFGYPVDQLTCDQILQAGLLNYISPEACDITKSDVASQTICGCSNLSAPASAPVTVPAPVAEPTPVTDPTTSEPTPNAAPPATSTPIAPTTSVTSSPVAGPPVETPPTNETPGPAPSDGQEPSACDESPGKGGMGMSKSAKGESGKGGGMMMGKNKNKSCNDEPKAPKAGGSAKKEKGSAKRTARLRA